MDSTFGATPPAAGGDGVILGASVPTKALETLLERVGLDARDTGGRTVLAGDDPVIDSRNRYGAATASALAAVGVGAATIWRMRSGETQDVQVDLRRAVTHGLRSIFMLQQNGHPFVIGAGGISGRNFFRTKDNRFVYMVRVYDYPHVIPLLLGVLRCSNDFDDMAQAVAQWNAQDLEDALAKVGAAGVIIRSEAEWMAHPQGKWLAERPGVEIRKIGDSPAEPFSAGTRPLDGIRVLDASHVIAGPATGRTLAEHGADVLRVSSPVQPDPAAMVMDLGFGKRSAFIDLNQVKDVEQLRQLAAQADVFIDSWRPGALARRGFSPEDLAAVRPGIIYVSVSCYGDGGPWASRGGYETIGQATSGLSMAEGSEEAPQSAPTITMNDYLTAYLAAAGVMGALVRRAREGGSYHVSTSLTQSSMWVLRQGQLNDAERATYQPAEAPAEWMGQTQSVFGEITHITPIVECSSTPAFWARPPQPFGASKAQWED